MVMLGATTSELVELAAQLGTTTGDIAVVQTESHGVATVVVDETEAAFVRAVTGITQAMDTLRGTVETARVRLDATTWTGANREVFSAAYGDFGAAMVGLEAAVHDAYAQFDGQMRQLGAVIQEFQTQVGASLTQAQESTASMQLAVDAQRDNLESVMNTGLAVS